MLEAAPDHCSQGRRLSKEYYKSPTLHNPNSPAALVLQIDESYDYVGDQLVAIRDHMGANESIITFTYDMFGPATLTYNGTTYYYLRNAQGDIMGISDEEGNQLVAYTYDAWGKPLSITGTMATTLGEANPFRYRGYFYDDETGLYYLQSRYYDPEVDRFISADGYISTGQGLLGENMFAYCNNNPITYIDQNGKEPISLSLAGIAAVFAAGAICIASLFMPEQVKRAVTNAVIDFFVNSLDALAGLANNFASVFSQTDEDAEEKAGTIPNHRQAIFQPNPYDFRPANLEMNVHVAPGTGSNGGIIKWEIPGTGIAIFEWNEDYKNGPHYHTLKIEWDNKHIGPHHPIGSPVPEPWNSAFFGGMYP